MARRTRPEDSLELLLDTMCNAFGGIIMIAILVALLIKDSKQVEKGPAPAAQASLVQRKLTQTREELATTEALRRELEQEIDQASATAKQVAERDALQKQVQQLAARADAAASILRSTDASTEARGKKDAIDRQKSALQKEMAEMEKTAQALSEKLLKLEQALAEARTKRTIDLGPPPAERETRKIPFNLIFRHGRLYPLHAVEGGKLTQNNSGDVKWTPARNGSHVEPQPGAGLAAMTDEAAVRRFIATLVGVKGSLPDGNELYVASYVYPDSFEAFLRFKKALAEAKTGIGQGWEPVKKDDELSFGPTGFKPGEQ